MEFNKILIISDRGTYHLLKMRKLIVFEILSAFLLSGYVVGAVNLPKADLNCYTCEGNECLRTSFVDKVIKCPTDDSCVSIFDGYIPIKKGCYSTLTIEEKQACDSNDDISCDKCTKEKCNNFGRIDHKCVQCSTTEYVDCGDKPYRSSEKRCQVPRTDSAYCFVQKANGVTNRGCIENSRQLQDCVRDSTNCEACLVNKYGACNVKEYGDEPNSSFYAVPSIVIIMLGVWVNM